VKDPRDLFNQFQSKIHRARMVGGTPEVFRRAVSRLRTIPRHQYRSPLSALAGLDLRISPFMLSSLKGLADLSDMEIPSLEEVTRWEYEAYQLLSGVRCDSTAEFGPEYDLGIQSSAFLYCLVRWTKPTQVFESGVARGVSTLVLLAALDANGRGALVSADITANVGQLVPRNHPRWHLVTLSATAPGADLAGILEDIGEIDLFVHDSDHSQSHQAFEYALAMENLSQHGILFSDDIDASSAFLDFCRHHSLPSVAIFDGHKISGAVIPNICQNTKNRATG
jgi:predicted O-methyltransferase YrrM